MHLLQTEKLEMKMKSQKKTKTHLLPTEKSEMTMKSQIRMQSESRWHRSRRRSCHPTAR